ncbi:RHS repeat-associated core domain-containing protein, partial [Microbacterium insulae]
SPTAWTYTYDARGNRLTATATGGVSSSQTLTFNAGNQVTTAGYSFDGAGNMTADPAGTYTYNGAQQMTGVSNGSGSFAYKYAGSSQVEVVQQQTSTTTYKLVYGRLNQVGMPVIEQAKIGSVTAYVENDPVTGQPLMLRTSTGAVSLYVYDGTGNPTAILRDVTGTGYVYTYDPYGLATLSYTSGGSGTGQNPFLFKGGIQDRATGWVHYGNRWYNPTTGRWTQQDTLDAPLDPNNANRYAYAGCDPINNLDPTGQLTLACTSALLRLSGNILGQLVRVAGFTGLIFGASVIPPAAILTAGALLAAGSAIGAFTTAISINDVARQC